MQDPSTYIQIKSSNPKHSSSSSSSSASSSSSSVLSSTTQAVPKSELSGMYGDISLAVVSVLFPQFFVGSVDSCLLKKVVDFNF
ncbi:hypothetical protein F0562_008614 [Nyssa sinensis]|uniref:Uncharacterized protein n=1 Tax=Nyssa sinensis TaxID=561372 RepID=A0A5J5ACG2_9ASTE|nr:hypothetical protein F0562_008614 [Nyssa sinensis]